MENKRRIITKDLVIEVVTHLIASHYILYKNSEEYELLREYIIRNHNKEIFDLRDKNLEIIKQITKLKDFPVLTMQLHIDGFGIFGFKDMISNFVDKIYNSLADKFIPIGKLDWMEIIL